VVRVVQEVAGHVEEAQTHDVAVLSRAAGQETEMVPRVVEKVAG